MRNPFARAVAVTTTTLQADANRPVPGDALARRRHRPTTERMRRNEPMATHQYRTLTKRIVDRLAVDDKDAVFWDRELPGFGLRVYPSGIE